ncbi:type II toxin-antitoxin system HipA family toxin [Occallatibacter riparius]|uniref:Type II toxin-antitoxin system HipA family toxin n=1 Tax=Occallatibacter riparius TaxID=1002689 RepID=A0A9J7BTG1_9BACT|nr:type II toxin-antitoxin system HipA family toxin [Occallatibacter riparius]UWZ85881.1 type II toxin-antitoxin system HipA family toxin [Occallatibacter riparius]
MPRTRYEPLNVFLNSRLVGQLRRDVSGAISFKYDQSWLEWEFVMPVSLSLPLRAQTYSGAPVIAVFDNLLPDNDDLRRQIAARTHAEGTDAYSLLGAIGHDCVGALQFLPQNIEPLPAGSVQGDPVSNDEIALIIENLAAAPLGISEDESFRISIAGAQEKTAFLYRDRKWYKPRGTTATTHIFKPSIGMLPNGMDLTSSVENEYFCLKVVAALGIEAAQPQIMTFGKRTVLVVERFDRRWTADERLLRLPQEDCCQALSISPTRKYQAHGGPGIVQILQLLRGSDDAPADQRAFLKANIIFWLMGATDGHAKNFSVFLRPGGRFRLTPLYDVISAQPSVDSKQLLWKNFSLAMSFGTKPHYKMRQIAPRHFFQTADEAGMGKEVVPSIIEELRAEAEREIDRVNADLPQNFPVAVADSISNGIRRRLRILEEGVEKKSS